MDQRMEVAPGADVSSGDIACWYDENEELWAVLCPGHRGKEDFLVAAREMKAGFVEEIEVLEEAMERALSAGDVHWLWIEEKGDCWYYWCKEDAPGAQAVTAIAMDRLPELQS